MQQLWQRGTSLLWSIISRPTIVDILDIAIVAFLIYKLLMLAKDTRASQVLKGVGVLFLLYWVSDWLQFRALNWILKLVVNSGPVVLVVLFQDELRRALERIGRAGSAARIRTGNKKELGSSVTQEIITALTRLSRRRVGALIVIERKTGLQDIIDTGTRIDSEISAPLIENIFEPNTPLHDGAVIVRGYRIEAAACILPLSQDTGISRDLGTRHRAALGVSELTDSVTLIVSEETGIISMARGGRITRYLDAEGLKQILDEIFGDRADENLGLLALLFPRKPHEEKHGK